MAKNNFQQLFDEEDEREFNETYGSKLSNVRGDVWQSLGLFRFIGDIVDAYIPRLLEAFIMATGGQSNNAEKDQHNDPASKTNNNNGPKGPAFDENIENR